MFAQEGYLFLLFLLRDLSESKLVFTRILVWVITVGGEGVLTFMVLSETTDIYAAYPFIVELPIGLAAFELAVFSTTPGFEPISKDLLLVVLHWLLFVPFFVVLPLGFLLLPDPYDFFYYYVVCAFIVISLIITAIGIFIHLILNLSSTTLRSLLVLSHMDEWMKKKLIAPNPDKILAIWQVFEDYGMNSDKLFEFLKQERATKVEVLDDLDC